MTATLTLEQQVQRVCWEFDNAQEQAIAANLAGVCGPPSMSFRRAGTGKATK